MHRKHVAASGANQHVCSYDNACHVGNSGSALIRGRRGKYLGSAMIKVGTVYIQFIRIDDRSIIVRACSTTMAAVQSECIFEKRLANLQMQASMHPTTLPPIWPKARATCDCPKVCHAVCVLAAYAAQRFQLLAPLCLIQRHHLWEHALPECSSYRKGACMGEQANATGGKTDTSRGAKPFHYVWLWLKAAVVILSYMWLWSKAAVVIPPFQLPYTM